MPPRFFDAQGRAAQIRNFGAYLLLLLSGAERSGIEPERPKD
jgi:hypothetical protein